MLRYVLTANMPETKDSEFTWKDYQDRNNNELVGVLGNFVNRVLVLQQKYFDGEVQSIDWSNWLEDDRIKGLELTFGEAGFTRAISQSLEQFRYREALNHMMQVARAGNKFLTDQEPWKKFKTDPQLVGEVLHICVQVVANLAIIMEPFLPFTAKKLRPMLAQPETLTDWSKAGRYDILPAGAKLGKPDLLFEKVDDETIQAQMDKLDATKQTDHPFPAVKDTIQYDDFVKLDLRVGTIVAAEKVKKADRLLHFKVDMGFEVRDIVSGVAEHFSPEELLNHQVVVVANLAPRKLKGIESKGMILMAEDADGNLSFLQPDNAWPNGATIS